MRMRTMFLVVVGVGTLLAGHAVAQTNGPSAVERLAERLLGYWGDPTVARAEIVPEGLPAALPVVFPLPADATLVGSVAHFERNELATVQVVVDAPQPPDEALGALLAGLAERGWVAAAMPPVVGFLPVQTSASGQACDPVTGIFAYLHASSRPQAATDIRIDINLASARYNPTCDAASLLPHPYGDQAPLPALSAPLDSELVPHGTVQMPDQASTTAVVSVGASVTDVAAHYAGRLALAGWTMQETGAQTGHVVTTWTYVDVQGSPWRGALTVVAMTGETPTFGLSFFVTPTVAGG